MTRILSLAALAIAMLTTMANAQTSTPGAPVNDSLFAQAAAVGGVAEVAISEIGLKRSSDSDLKKFSQEMIDDHQRINQELTTLAAQKRIVLPRVIDSRAQFCEQSLNGASRDTFDHCYAKAQWVAHMETAAMFEAEAERGQDADMKAFASKYLPRIKEHLAAIKPIAMRLDKEHASNADNDRDKNKDQDKNKDKDKEKERARDQDRENK